MPLWYVLPALRSEQVLSYEVQSEICSALFPHRTFSQINTSKRSPALVVFFILVLFLFFMHIIVISNFKGVNFVDKKQHQQPSQKIPCALHGSHLCPKPKECNGINRLCTIWEDHSGR